MTGPPWCLWHQKLPCPGTDSGPHVRKVSPAVGTASSLDPDAAGTEVTRPTEAAAGSAAGRARPSPRRAGDAPARRQPRDGVVVPLRVPWSTRLRATAGLIVMIAFLGTATAMVIGAIAIAVAQALGSL